MALGAIELKDLTDPYHKVNIAVLPSRIDRIEKAVKIAVLDELNQQKAKCPNEKAEHAAAILRFHLKGEAKIPELPDEISVNDNTGAVKNIRSIVKTLLSIVLSTKNEIKPLEKIGIGIQLSSMPGYNRWINEATHYTSLTYILLVMMGNKREREYISAGELYQELQSPTAEISELEAYKIIQSVKHRPKSAFEKVKAALDRLSEINNQKWKFIVKKDNEKYAIFKQEPQKNGVNDEVKEDDTPDEIDETTEIFITDDDAPEALVMNGAAQNLELTSKTLGGKASHNFAKGQKSSELEQYIRDVYRYRLLTHEEEIELAKKAEAGDEKARQQIINASLRFVIKIAFEYKNPEIPLMDIIQAGNIGITIAAKKFDYKRGYRFISYAVWWIKAMITDEIRKQRNNVRHPSIYDKAITKIRRYIAEFEKMHGKKPTHAECKARFPKKNTSSIQIALGHFNQEIRLEDEILGSDEDKSRTIADSIGQHDAGFDEIEKRSLAPVIKKITTILKEVIADRQTSRAIKDRTEYIIMRRYEVLNGKRNSGETENGTLQDIGNEFGISRERVRQMTEEIVRKAKPKIMQMLIENTGEASINGLFEQSDDDLIIFGEPIR